MSKLRSKHVLEVMTDIDEEYIQSALNRLDYLSEDKSKGTRQSGKEYKKNTKEKNIAFSIMKRVAIFIGVVILVTTTTVATAMAFSEEFRETVKEIIFEFFRVEEEEMVPEMSHTELITTDNMYVEQDRSIIGGVIEGRYVHAPMACLAREGVYRICTDEIELNQGSHYDAYYEENGEFIKLEEYTFSGDYTVLGNDFHIEFDWAAHGGQVALTYIGVEEPYRIPANPGDKDAMLVELLCSFPTEGKENTETVYPVLLNPETGELMDVLAGTGAEKLINLCNQAISEDGSKMLLAQSDGTLYYVDLVKKKLYSVEDISGERADACSLIGNALSCWVLEEDSYRAWTIDLATMERKELFCNVPNAMAKEVQDGGIVYLSGFDTTVHWGTMFAGSHFALERDTAGNVTVLNLATGDEILIEGFIWPEGRYQDLLWEASPDGKRLLISAGENGSKYEYIGVLDFEKMSYLEFGRKNNNEVYEWKPYWFDKDTVIIQATGKDSYYARDYYVYELLDETAIIIEGTVEKVPTAEYESVNYSIAVPEEGWIQYDEESWVSEVNETVKLWVTDCAGEEIDTVRDKLSGEGYQVSEADPYRLIYTDENAIVRNVKLFTGSDRTVAVFYQYPVEATEGFGTRLSYIVNTFTWKNAD